LVRHGESAGNVARDAAEAEGLTMIDIAQRDMDVPLSPLGEQQAEALGAWIGKLPPEQRPTAVLTSPYVRAAMTGHLALEAAGYRPGDDIDIAVDERLREREFGILDRLTRSGIGTRYPEQAEFRAFLGKFYHRPPGGESWADVALRLRTLLMTLTRDYEDERVLIVSHQVVILMFRYILERLSEAEVLQIDREQELANCSLTSYERTGLGRQTVMSLTRFNDVVPVAEAGAPITEEEDVSVGPR
jgi:broad specificity phosphatase PhoE